MKILRKLYLVIAIMAIVMVYGTTHVVADETGEDAEIGEIFVYDDGTQLTISWPDDLTALYYEVVATNLTKKSAENIEKLVFESPAIMGGLIYHDIYEITVKTDGEAIIGHKYITFALEQTSGNCVCICPELVIPKKIFYGLVSENWWTGIAISNAGDTSQPVVLKIGTINKIVVVPSHTVEAFLLRDLIDDTTSKSYPITYETESADIGVTVLISDSVNVFAQN